MNVGYSLHGKYTTDLVTEESLRVIATHNASKPLFLYVSHAAVHSGNPYDPLRSPDADVSKMQHIDNYGRRKYAGKRRNTIAIGKRLRPTSRIYFLGEMK